jgi:hypothetical protein
MWSSWNFGIWTMKDVALFSNYKMHMQTESIDMEWHGENDRIPGQRWTNPGIYLTNPHGELKLIRSFPWNYGATLTPKLNIEPKKYHTIHKNNLWEPLFVILFQFPCSILVVSTTFISRGGPSLESTKLLQLYQLGFTPHDLQTIHHVDFPPL